MRIPRKLKKKLKPISCTCYDNGIRTMLWFKVSNGNVHCMRCEGKQVTKYSMRNRKKQNR